VGHVAHVGYVRNTHEILVGKPQGKRQFGKSRRKWKASVRMDLRGTGWEGVDWIHLDQDRDHWQDLVSTVMNIRGLEMTGNFLTS